ncbi:MAG: TetR/AcrR family transcriptional regulator [Gemmatimonadales bacterium]
MPSTARRTWKRRSDARPGEIRAAALRLFAERGFGGTKIEDVALAANVTVGTVYRYFRDKDALLADLVDTFSAVPLLGEAPRAEDSPLAQIEQLSRLVWTASRTEPHLHLIRLLIAQSGNEPALVERYRARVIEPAERALAEPIGRLGGRDPDIVAKAVLGALLGASVLGATSPNALVPQLAAFDVTLPVLLGGLARPGLDEPRPVPAPPPTVPAGPIPVRRPDSW